MPAKTMVPRDRCSKEVDATVGVRDQDVTLAFHVPMKGHTSPVNLRAQRMGTSTPCEVEIQCRSDSGA